VLQVGEGAVKGILPPMVMPAAIYHVGLGDADLEKNRSGKSF
jgi:hypothetical protein